MSETQPVINFVFFAFTWNTAQLWPVWWLRHASGVIEVDGVHNIKCHHRHMKGSLLSNYGNIVDPQAMKAVETGIDDPKGHLYPDFVFS